MIKKTLFLLLTLLMLNGCSQNDRNENMRSGGGMKCGAGKCGANMFDGNLALAKKKKSMLSQMRDDDSRKGCIVNAKSTKEVYNCVRDPKTQRISLKCGTKSVSKDESSGMKCGGNMKCGGGMQCGGAMKCGGM